MSDLITKFTKFGDKVVLLEELNKSEPYVDKSTASLLLWNLTNYNQRWK